MAAKTGPYIKTVSRNIQNGVLKHRVFTKEVNTFRTVFHVE
jgi:hypothetical protein